MPFTTRGMKLMLDAYFRNGTEPTNFYLALVTSATAPSLTTKTMSELTEIAAGNGYTAGGYQLARNSTDFSSLSEADSNQRTEMAVKNIAWTASGGNIPASGNPARYLVLTTDEGTIANRQIVWYQSLGGNKTITSGNTLTIANIKARILGGSVIKSIQRGTVSITGTNTTGTATVTAVDTTKAKLALLGEPFNNPGGSTVTGYIALTNSTTITATRATTGGFSYTSTFSYELTEYF